MRAAFTAVLMGIFIVRSVCDLKTKEIRVLKVEPYKVPYEATLKTDLESLQEAVGIGSPQKNNLIELVSVGKNVSILLNEEGKLLSLPGNRKLGRDILAGVFYVVGDSKSGGLRSLTDSEIEYWSKVFEEPEYYTDSEVMESMLVQFISL